jgi:ribosomal protein S18 acetylase RimI-like enzyme
LEDARVVVTPEHPSVTLRPMTIVEFDAWRDVAIRQHAEQTSRATGRSLEASLDDAAELLPKVLVDGINTRGMDFFVIVDVDDQEIGWLWIGSSPDDPEAGFVWDIIIEQSRRGRGYGRAAMLAAEQFFAAKGKVRIGLQVAARNDVARRLYEAMGYQVTMTTMSKAIAAGTHAPDRPPRTLPRR